MVLEIIRAILGFLLVLFIPGYAFMLALYPKKKDLSFVERIALSSVSSIAITMLSALFLDMFLGIDLTAENVAGGLIAFSVICFALWLAQTRGRY
jgi:uncharacterized membrane protein